MELVRQRRRSWTGREVAWRRGGVERGGWRDEVKREEAEMGIDSGEDRTMQGCPGLLFSDVPPPVCAFSTHTCRVVTVKTSHRAAVDSLHNNRDQPHEVLLVFPIDFSMHGV